MCGIAGVWGLDSSTAEEVVRRMTASLAHRGPDDAGVFADNSVALGHRRLSIIDLSARGHQPMQTPDGRYAVAFNGEIYNFRSLRNELQNRGYVFCSKTDTEVLLYAFAEWKEKCLERLCGDFAFAAYEADAKRLLLGRDRFGVKPLYYYPVGDGRLLFASEVRSLLCSGLVPGRLNVGVLPFFLSYQTVPTPDTLVFGVRMLPAGHYAWVDGSGVSVHVYWHLLGQVGREAGSDDQETVRRTVREKMLKAVERQMVSDVPLGAFLSGGIDSSVIVGLMSQVVEGPIRTFTVAFGDPRFEDQQYARLVARHFGTEHTEVTLGYDDLLQWIPEALDAFDHCSADGINTYIVARAARQSGLTVALSGLGGDELFAGYGSFRRLALQQKVRFFWKLIPRSVRACFARLTLVGSPSVAAHKLHYLLRSEGTLAQVLPMLRCLYAPDQVDELLENGRLSVDPYVTQLQQTFDSFPDIPLLSKISFAEMHVYMSDVLLRDTDQMSMAHALEVRVPFLDHELAEYVIGVQDTHKRPQGTPKRLLVEALDGLLPKAVVQRPKQGFGMPFDRWMRGPLRPLCERAIDKVAGLPVFKAEKVLDCWDDFLREKRNVSWAQLWLLVALGHWMQKNRIE